jgi:2'-5' RNA ligase
MRLFVGIPLAAVVIDELSATTARLKSGRDGLRWAAPASWHITLQFLGNTNQQQYECIQARLGELRLPPVPIWLEGLGFFERAGIFFAGVRLTPRLLSLQERVTAATAECGFVPETRPFQPHITLARRKGGGFGELQTKVRRPPNFSRFVAGEFVLYESLTGPAGTHYEIRARFPLGASSMAGASPRASER